MIAVDGENYDKEGKHFPKSIEKLDKVLKYIFSQLRIEISPVLGNLITVIFCY